MSQPTGADPSQWEKRDPANAPMRKLISEVQALKATTVKHSQLNKLLGAAATVIVGGSWHVANRAIDRSDARQAEALRPVVEDVRRIREEQIELKLLARGTAAVVVEQRKPREVAREVREAATALDGGAR
jgi:hypothetical protein